MKCKECKQDITQLLDEKAKEAGFCEECWTKPFNITSVARADLVDKFTPKQITKLTDYDMEELADKMAEAYTENNFWIELKVIADEILEDK